MIGGGFHCWDDTIGGFPTNILVFGVGGGDCDGIVLFWEGSDF